MRVIDEALWDSAATELPGNWFNDWIEGQATIDSSLSPLAQVMISLRIAQTGIIRMLPLHEHAPILHQSLLHYSGTTLSSAFIDESTGAMILWAPALRLHTSSFTAKFGNQIARMLNRLEILPFFSELTRKYLLNLIFHPLQNTQRHGRKGAVLGSPFSGISMRVVPAIQPLATSAFQYLTEVIGAPESGMRFLEIIIHDDGLGIAEHYRRSRVEHAHDLQAFDVSREWVWLKRAFERHVSSRIFRESVDAVGYQPGIGLASMLSAAKHLRCFVEVRAGRLRAYQYFQHDERISWSVLLRPNSIPPEGAHLPGTIIRLFVPLPESS